MFLYGREIGLAVTVGASVKLARLCPGNDLKRIAEVLDSDNQADTMEAVMKMAVIMSEAYETRRAHTEEDYEPNPLTMEEVESLDLDEIGVLFTAVTEAVTRDQSTSVITKPAKGVKKNAK